MLSGLAPVWRGDARLLILGSFPGAASLHEQQYYAHPRNAFWPLMGALVGALDLPARPYADRLQALLDARIALWDAVAACDRPGSLDAHIRAAQPNDVRDLVQRLPSLVAVACNGATAHKQTTRLLPGWELIGLPSSSPAHAGLSLSAKQEIWLQRLRGVTGVSGTG
jgi:TDG/mug DNA glycosylase family protein